MNNKMDIINENLLGKIKSKVNLNRTLLYLDEKIKLQLIKYNNDLKNKIDLNLYNYKVFSGRYILYETKGKGKEYCTDDDRLLFEGEFKNGERWKGKEYDIIYYLRENYLNGEKRKGKEYGVFKRLIFEGEYLHERRNGKGKEYDVDDNILFEGELEKN